MSLIRKPFDDREEFPGEVFEEPTLTQQHFFKETKAFMSQLDAEVKKAKDSEDSDKLKKANLALRDFVLRLGSDPSPDNN